MTLSRSQVFRSQIGRSLDDALLGLLQAELKIVVDLSLFLSHEFFILTGLQLHLHLLNLNKFKYSK